MKKLILMIGLFCNALYGTIGSAWLQSKAAACGQQNQWQQAQTYMNQLMVNRPDQPDIVYDSGVAAYRLQEFQKAAAYFENVTKMPHVERDLKKQAHFNWGNTNVALNQLPQAIEQYQAVLAIEPDNQPAHHNLKKVKEMLEQQQQEQKENQQNKNKEQSKNNKNDKNQNNQSSQNHDDQQNEKHENKQGDQGGSDTQKDRSSPHKKNDQSSRGNEEKKDDASDQQEGQQERKSNDKSSQQDRNQNQNELRDSHDSSSQKETNPHNQKKSSHQPIKNGSKEQETQQGMLEDKENEGDEQKKGEEFGAHEQWMARLLASQEKADKAAQKALIKTNINKQLAGHHGQNCW